MKFENMLESSLQPAFLTRCRQVLTAYTTSAEHATIVPLQNLGFSGARIAKVEIGGREFALRQWPQPGLPLARLSGLHRLLEFLQENGFAELAVPIRSIHDRSIVTEQGANWQLEPWLPGQADYHRNPGRQRLTSAMQALARWHLIAERHHPAPPASEWFSGSRSATSPAVRERLAVLSEFRNSPFFPVVTDDMLRGIDNEVADRLRFLGDLLRRTIVPAIDSLRGMVHASLRLQPCLRDVWHDHILFVGDTVTGVIDPSACRTENVATDLARLLGSLVEDDPAEWAFALKVYQAARPLTPAELQLVQVLDRSATVASAVTWLQWLLRDRRQFPDTQAVKQRLAMWERRLKHMM